MVKGQHTYIFKSRTFIHLFVDHHIVDIFLQRMTAHVSVCVANRKNDEQEYYVQGDFLDYSEGSTLFPPCISRSLHRFFFQRAP